MDLDPDDLQSIPIERRQDDRRRSAVDVIADRRQNDRRALRLSPTRAFSGVAVVVDGWPLLRAGVRQMLTDSAMRVAADNASVEHAADAVGDRLDLAVLGTTRESLEDAVVRIRDLPGPDGTSAPKVLLLLDRVDVDQLRRLFVLGVDGALDRSIGLEDLRAACERLLAGQRVLAGQPLSALASVGLELQHDETDRGDPLLTRKELEVLAELARHLSNREIAANLHLSSATIKTHLSNIYAKLVVSSRREAIVAAVERGLLT